MTKTKKFLLTMAIMFLILPMIILAQEADPVSSPTGGCADKKGQVCLNVPIGGVKQASFEQYLELWYNFVLGTAGIIATVIIMWGGFKWLTSRGNSAAIADAKDRIWSAVIGLILIFLSYTLLAIINPQLVTNIGLPTLETVRVTLIQAPGNTTGSTIPPANELQSSPLPENIRFDYEYQPPDLESGQPWLFEEDVAFKPDGQGQYWASWDGMDQEDIRYFISASRAPLSPIPLTITGINTNNGIIEVIDDGINNLNPNSVSFTIQGIITGEIRGVRVSPPPY